MWAIDSSRHRALIGCAWVGFAAANTLLTFVLPGQETIPYHLAWASFAFVYGLCPWPKLLSRAMFAAVTIATGLALVRHAINRVIGWEECTEIVLMAAILALLMWHVDRQRAAQDHLSALQTVEREQAMQRDTFARFGSHEVRTRLTIARGHAEIIADTAEDPGIVADARIVLGELDKATATVTNILTLVRVVQHPTRTPIDFDALIAAVVRRWAGAASRRWATRTAVGWIDADPERLETLLDCLLENAVKFTSRDDSISVDASSDGMQVTITVRDEGSGIRSEDVGRIFDLFAIGANAGSRAGSGIGLPIVKAIVDARGGSIDVESAVGRGTAFTVTLPLGGHALVHAEQTSPRSSPSLRTA